ETVFLPGAEIDDALVSDEAGVAAVEDGEEFLETLGNVVGLEDRELGGLGEAGGARHADIHPGNDEDGGGAERGRRNGGPELRARSLREDVAGEEGGEVFRDADGADAGAAAAV